MTSATLDQRHADSEDEVLLTVPEAAKLLRISRWGVYRLIHSRQLTTIKIGARRLIPREAVTKLIDRLSQEDNL